MSKKSSLRIPLFFIIFGNGHSISITQLFKPKTTQGSNNNTGSQASQSAKPAEKANSEPVGNEKSSQEPKSMMTNLMNGIQSFNLFKSKSPEDGKLNNTKQESSESPTLILNAPPMPLHTLTIVTEGKQVKTQLDIQPNLIKSQRETANISTDSKSITEAPEANQQSPSMIKSLFNSIQKLNLFKPKSLQDDQVTDKNTPVIANKTPDLTPQHTLVLVTPKAQDLPFTVTIPTPQAQETNTIKLSDISDTKNIIKLSKASDIDQFTATNSLEPKGLTNTAQVPELKQTDTKISEPIEIQKSINTSLDTSVEKTTPLTDLTTASEPVSNETLKAYIEPVALLITKKHYEQTNNSIQHIKLIIQELRVYITHLESTLDNELVLQQIGQGLEKLSEWLETNIKKIEEIEAKLNNQAKKEEHKILIKLLAHTAKTATHAIANAAKEKARAMQNVSTEKTKSETPQSPTT